MEPALDEASLVPCPMTLPHERIQRLANTLKALDGLGAPRVLLSVRDAADRDIEGGRGLRHWCFDRKTPRDEGRFVAQRLDRAPYIDGSDGLFAAAEAGRAIQPTICGIPSLGGGHVALKDGVLVLLAGSAWPPAKPVVVRLEVLTADDQWTDDATVDAVDCAKEAVALSEPIARKVEAALKSGLILLGRFSELYPHVVLGDRAVMQLSELTGSEPFYPQVFRHLRTLNRAAEKWIPGTPFEPEGVTFSVESNVTLNHGTFGPKRDFPTPSGFETDRWTLHTKLTGGNGARLYYKSREVEIIQPDGLRARRRSVAVGYLGPHLDTVKFH